MIARSLDRVDSLQPGPLIEVRVKGEDRRYPVALHDRDVNSIAGGQRGSIRRDLSRARRIAFFDGEDIVHDAKIAY